jgi:membrane protein DedA with SNARE-associated domain
MPVTSIVPLLALAGQSPLLQCAAIILGTFILEDAATILAAISANQGTVSLSLALISLFAGILLGDLGLYALGRASASVPWIARLLPPHRQDAVRAWLNGRVFRIVLVSRFVPGMRLPTYTTCGFLGADLRQFVLAAVPATLVWTSLLFGVSLRIGQVLMNHLGAWRWAGAAGFTAAVILTGRLAATRLRSSGLPGHSLAGSARSGASAKSERPVSFFEFWPGWLFYAPVVAHWLALGLRYRDFSLPTAANPHITTGGLCGESKLAILRQVGPEARRLVAPATGSTTDRSDTRADLVRAEQAMAGASLAFPVVAKPDIGCNGTGVRLLHDAAELQAYLAEFPRGATVMLQQFVPDPGEAGIFYIRHPGEPRGRITSITLKEAPIVIGDGVATLRQLIMADLRAGRVPHLYLDRLAHRLHEVPRQGEHVRLVFVGNHCKGSVFRDGREHATAALADAMDRLAGAMPDFHFGRIDVRFSSLAALRRGEGFRVIEINGVGSEATHVWDPRTGLLDAWRAQFFHYGQAFRIGAANRARGFKPSGVRAMWQAWRHQRRLMAAYPGND